MSETNATTQSVPRLYEEEDVTALCEELEVPYKVQGDFVWGPPEANVRDKLGDGVMEALLQAGFRVVGKNRAGEPIHTNSPREGRIYHDTTRGDPDEAFGDLDDVAIE